MTTVTYGSCYYMTDGAEAYDAKWRAIFVKQDQNLVDNSHARYVSHLIRITWKQQITALDNLSSEERKAQQMQ